jgi:hypothetical protein
VTKSCEKSVIKTVGGKGSQAYMLSINIPCFCVGKNLYDGINNVARETYPPKGWYVENLFRRRRRPRALQPIAVERGLGMGSNKAGN